MKETDSDWKKFYWIDIVKFFRHFVGNNQILQKVYYFTAPPLKLDKSNRQSELLLANMAINANSFEVIRGQFYEKQVTCKVCKNKYTVAEEKRTDVNISVRMMRDCATGDVDTIVLVCADSDLIPPLQCVKELYPEKKVRVYFPPGLYSGAHVALMKAENKNVVRLEKSKMKFAASIMPDSFTIDGKSYTTPAKWKVN